MLDDAQVLSKWGAQTVDANPDMAKARRRVESLDPQWRFCFSTAVEFDPATDSVICCRQPALSPADLQKGSR